VIVSVGADESFGQVTWNVMPRSTSLWSKTSAATDTGDERARAIAAKHRRSAVRDFMHASEDLSANG
jgi:hypothetical protein